MDAISEFIAIGLVMLVTMPCIMFGFCPLVTGTIMYYLRGRKKAWTDYVSYCLSQTISYFLSED